jgi:hypothetical protein
MASKNITLIGAVAVASAGAFFAGRMTAPGSNSSSGAGSDAALAGKVSSRSGGGADQADGTAGRRDGGAGRESGKGNASVRGEKAMAKMQELMLVTDPMERNKAWLDFLNKMDPAEFEGVVADFRNSGLTDTRMAEYSMLLTAWAKKDPLQALAYAASPATRS